jgi:alkylhydroperoxidase family enzyme
VPTHVALGRSAGLDEAQLAALSSSAPGEPDMFSPTEQVVVDYARRLTRLEPIDDDLYAELTRHFTLQQIMELCFTVGIACTVNRFHATFHTPLDEKTQAAFADGSPLALPPRPDGTPG